MILRNSGKGRPPSGSPVLSDVRLRENAADGLVWLLVMISTELFLFLLAAPILVRITVLGPVPAVAH